MKKVTRRSKTGFTLLEVLLATVIMVIASTMIMKGFISVMVIGRNSRAYAKSGEANYRLAMSQTLANNATASNQIDNIALLTDGDFGELSAEYLNGAAPGVDLTNLNITIDITDYSDETAGLTYNIDGDDIDNSSVVNNRFAFFYDFGDYLGPNAVNGNHVIRYGFIMSPARPSGSEASYLNPLDSFFDHILYVDKNGNGLTGNDDPTNARNEFVAYVHYGWYCFNETHNESNCPYRGYGDHNSGYAPANQH